MSILNEQLNTILNKYDIRLDDIRTPEFMRDTYRRELRALISSFKSGARVGIYGIGANAVHFLDSVSNEFYRDNVVCFIDNDTEKHEPFKTEDIYKSNPKPVITSDKIHEYALDAVIIVHFNSRKVIRAHVNDICPELACHDIYEMTKGVDFEAPYWNCDFYFRKLLFEKNKLLYEYKASPLNTSEKTGLLKKLIACNIVFKDFYNTELLIRDYVFLELPDYQKYGDFWTDFLQIISQAKEKIRSREKEHLFVFGIDSFRLRNIEDMRFVKFMAEASGITFENAVSSSDWTSYSYKGLISGKSFYTDKLYADEKLTPDNCPCVKKFKELGYKLKFMGGMSSVLKSIKGINEVGGQLYEKYTGQALFFACELYWDWLCDLYEEDESAVYFIHSMLEIHPPNLNNLCNNVNVDFPPFRRLYTGSGRLPYDFNAEDVSEILNSYKKQIQDSCVFLDRIIEFYAQFFNLQNDTVVFMGDHGQDYENLWYLMKSPERGILSPNKPSLNPGLIVIDKDLTPRVEKRFLSYKSLMNVFFEIKEGNGDIEPFLRDYAIAESPPYYTLSLFEEELHKKDQQQKYGYITIFTETEKYIRYTNGVEKYYVFPYEYYERDNLMSHPQYRERAEWFRSLIKDIDFTDLYNYEKFATAKKILIDKTIKFDMLNNSLSRRKNDEKDLTALQYLDPYYYREKGV